MAIAVSLSRLAEVIRYKSRDDLPQAHEHMFSDVKKIMQFVETAAPNPEIHQPLPGKASQCRNFEL